MEGNGYTRDGTVDLQGQPIFASKTGKWKAFAFLLYKHKVRNTKSPVKDLIRVPIAAIKNRKLALPSDPSELHKLEPQHYNTGKR
ncbi:hypothetical protein GIB67_030418 [Kingdonia uniflora]|uniref:Uncharacterized protein n=1 Tax=Kingdonia uniflora TaxID=39325 RepID=A0A7J7NDI8_9MAGN|nr:hypothetical protein GIB67_030418 [Kingdonia uniflora]